jgi:glutaredoxin
MYLHICLHLPSLLSSLTIRKNCRAIQELLSAHGIAYTLVDVTSPDNAEAAGKMQALSGTLELPQVFVRGQFVGLLDTLMIANETGQLKELLVHAQ